MKKYCEICEKEVDTTIIEKKEKYFVCGEEVEVNAHVLVCNECGEELFSEELDNETLVTAYNIYRKNHKLLFPEEIKHIREQYGLSQRSFGKLLGWGDKTIFRYENGSIQDKAHNSMLIFIKDPKNMRTYLSENTVSLKPKAVEKLLQRVTALENNEIQFGGNKALQIATNEPSEENGYRSFDFDKFSGMVLYFANRTQGLLKTKLMKLLHYTDMVYYKENGVSISGVRYAHLPYGPVPENFDILFGSMEAYDIAHIEVVYENGYEKHQVIPDKIAIDNVLSKKELEMLERVYLKFENFGSRDISNYSHQEKGYKDTLPGQIISYAYAKYINL